MEEETIVEEKKVENQEVKQVTPVETPESEDNVNWKKFREQREKERSQLLEERKQREEIGKQKRKAEDEAKALKEALEALVTIPEEKKDDEEDRIANLVEAKLAERERKRVDEQKKKEVEEMPQRLKSMHNDFEQVCSQENFDYMEYHYPEIVKPYAFMPDSIEKWSSVYKAMKRLIPNPNSKKDEIRAEKNALKPQASATLSQSGKPESPLALSEAKKKQNWERMQREMKGTT